MQHIVIVGGGLAGYRALSALRDFEGEVTLVSDERHKPYDRPPLSKQILLGHMTASDTYFKVDDLKVDWKLGRAAIRLDTNHQVVTLQGGEEIAYDGLVIATGRRAAAWPGAIPEYEGFFTLRSLDDALKLRDAALAAKRIAIVGAGFIGCEVAASMRRHGCGQVTLIEMADQVMPTIGPDAGAFARRIHEDEGVHFKLGAQVTGFTGEDGAVTGVEIEGEDPVQADLVLLSLGSTANSGWLEGSGIRLSRGNVCCDEHLFAVGAVNVVAAGDVAAWMHPHADSDDGRVCIEHWTTSREMAKTAVANLLASSEDRSVFRSVPTFWSDQYDVKIKSAGYLRAADRIEVIEADEVRRRLVLEAFAGDELVGAILFNRNGAFVQYQKQLRETLAVKPSRRRPQPAIHETH